EVAPEAAADVEHELSPERLDGERAAQVAAEVRAPLARELRPRRPEVEPLAGEALERVGERVVGRGRRRRQLGMAREEVRVAPRDPGEERRADQPRHAGDDREARPAPRAGERPLLDLARVGRRVAQRYLGEGLEVERAVATRAAEEIQEP